MILSQLKLPLIKMVCVTYQPASSSVSTNNWYLSFVLNCTYGVLILTKGEVDAHLMKCRLKVMDVVVGDILEGGSGDDLDVVFEVG